MKPSTGIQYSQETITWTMDCSDILVPGEIITQVSSVSVEPTGPSLVNPSYTDTSASVQVSGLTADVTYSLSALVTTDLGDVKLARVWIQGEP